MKIETKFDIEQMVYLKTDQEQLERMVTTIKFMGSAILYGLAHGTSESWHFEFEITSSQDVLKKVT